MKKLVLFNLMFFIATNALAQDQGNDILKAADLYRNSWESFIVHTRIINYKDEKQDGSGEFEVMIKGNGKSLVRFLNPDQKGQYLLMLEDLMWLYMPNTRRPIRVTPLQRLMGDASNGDVARTNFSRDYHATLIGEETINEQPCFKLELKATNQAATYPRVEYWVTKKESLPVKAELFLASGKLYKSVSYESYDQINGKLLLRKMILYDRLRSNRYTVMEYLNYEPRDIPEKYFNKNYLSQLK